MLRTFRKNAQNWMIKGVLWLVVAAFVGTIFLVWGRGGDVSKTDMAAIVNDRVISLSQYYNEYQNLEQVYREIYGNIIDKNVIDSNTLKREALENLINRELFSEAAEKLNIKVSDDEVQRAIAMTPAFATDGQFDRERYLSILRTNGITPKNFEEQMKRDLKLKKLQRFIQSTVMISEKEILDRYATIKREIRLNYVSLDPASMKVPPPKSEDIQLYYADNKESFRVPAKVNVEYALFKPEQFNENVTVTEAEINTYYEANPEKYLAPERRRFHEIILPYNNTRGREANIEMATKIRDEVVSGTITFDEGMKKYSKANQSNNDGGERWYEKKDLPRESANTLFSLPTDAVTEPIDTGKSVKLLKLAEIKRSDPYPLEKIRETVVRDLKKEKSQDLAIIKAYEARGMIAKGEDFEKVVADYGLRPVKTGFVSHDEVSPQLKDVVSSAYLLSPGEAGEVKKSDRDQIVFRLLERKDSWITPLDEVTAKIEKILEQKAKYQKTLHTAEEIIAAGKDKGVLGRVAGDYKLSLKRTPYFSPLSSPGIPGMQLSTTMVENVLSLGKTNRIADKPLSSGEKVFVIEFAGEKEISMKDYEIEKKRIGELLLEQKKGAALSAFIKEQRDRSNIEISGDLDIKPSDEI
jgi:peptidyl-prolyl cis-trans isomerase D